MIIRTTGHNHTVGIDNPHQLSGLPHFTSTLSILAFIYSIAFVATKYNVVKYNLRKKLNYEGMYPTLVWDLPLDPIKIQAVVGMAACSQQQKQPNLYASPLPNNQH